ncbi:DNA adenine methylase [Colwellia sp. BRX8-7]|jgi:DNA adenine methylase|uniref:DNA adenine methylase n=1 Tax=Colwellia sp. BRX8-7 TaxID=2759833 RepID=UPI0015F6D18F|nr:DNA adenine methylase [Colwellia sp. BRX8-7]MBA6337932.1 DNA adenine methylase [Colwellia sp. BRX8-7]
MPQTPTPLRYPGGKSSVWPMVSKLISENNLENREYAEPFAGGCGLALNLLFRNKVSKLHLNDFDPSIWSFWYSVLNLTNELIDMIQQTPVTIEEWHKQREIHKTTSRDNPLILGFSTFFLNRTNRSGIILKAGVIGGKSQAGEYKLDCRFNKKGLIEKIVKIAERKHDIQLYNLDALEFFSVTDKLLSKKGLYCIDPPYYMKGQTLYTNFYEHDDHVQLAKVIESLRTPWILTYDNASEIKALYTKFDKFLFNLNYSAARKRKGTELFVKSKNLSVDIMMKDYFKKISNDNI